MKKRSPKEIIESEKDATVEHHFTKSPGRETIPTTESSRDWVTFRDTEKIEKIYKESGGKKYTLIHTHVAPIKDFGSRFLRASSIVVLPSYMDIENFLKDEKAKSSVIVQQDPKTREVAGYLYLRKPKKFKEIDIRGYGREDYIKHLEEQFAYRDSTGASYFYKLMKKYGIKYRFMPAKGYKLDWMERGFVKIKKNKGIESKVAQVAGLFFLVSIFFLSSNFTGFAISNLNPKTSNLIGVIFFVIGLIGISYYFSRRIEK